MQAVVDGILTHYEIIGKKPKKLLILHGWMRSYDEWIPLANKISDLYEIILLDLPGFGKTAMPDNTFSIYDYATFADHFLDKIEVNKVTFLGHSFGGRIGIILSAKTNKITDLILVDAAGIEKRSRIALLKITIFKLAKRILPSRLVEKLRNSIGSPDYKSAGALRPIFLKVINEDLSYLLPKIEQSTLIVWGNKDTEVSEWKTRKMKKLIKHSILKVIWGSGHNPHIDKLNELTDAILDFIKQ